MTRILLILLFIINISHAQDFAEKYKYQSSYEKAIQKAKKEKKDIVFILVGDYCPWCDKLKDEVLSLEYTNEILHKYYVPIMVDTGYDKYPYKYDARIIPTVHFISYKDESILESVVGFNANYRFYEIIEGKNKDKKVTYLKK